MTSKMQVYVTSIHSTPKIRKNHDTVKMLLQQFEPYETLDVASDDNAKRTWRSKASNNPELPCIVVNGQRVGSIEELEEANEVGEIRSFLRIDESPDEELPQLSAEEAAQLAKELEQESEKKE